MTIKYPDTDTTSRRIRTDNRRLTNKKAALNNLTDCWSTSL